MNERTAACFGRDEQLLVEQAERLPTEQLAILLRHWQGLVDEDGTEASADAARQRSFPDLAQSWGGNGFRSRDGTLIGRANPTLPELRAPLRRREPQAA